MKKSRKTPGERLKEYSPELPKAPARNLFMLLCNIVHILRPVSFNYAFDKKKMRGRQVLLLSQHPSKDDPVHLVKGYPFILPNVVMGYHNFFMPVLFDIFLAGGVIPKYLFVPDIRTAKSLIKLRKKGASVFIYPEGIQSMDGTAHMLDKGTVKMIRMMKSDTGLCTAHGAYLARPRFDSHFRRGHVEYNFELLFTKEEAESLSDEQISERLIEKFRYNDFLWNSEKQYSYGFLHSNAKGLDKILFVCPVCKKQFGLRIKGRKIICECGNTVKVDRKYNLIPDKNSVLPFKRIDEWYRYGKNVVDNEIQDENFKISYRADYLSLKEEKLGFDPYVYLGSGTVTLTREKLIYEGSIKGVEGKLEFEISKMPSAPFVSGLGNEFYYDSSYYQFRMTEDKRLSVKILMAIEALNGLTDPERIEMQKEMDKGYE